MNDAWILINNVVYDITYYMNCHPGGKEILIEYLGKDGTKEFNKYHQWVNA